MPNADPKFFAVAKYYEELKERMKEVRKDLDGIMATMAVGSYHQDPETGAVYKIVKPSGTFVEFRDLGYERTALAGEARGSLSKKEAQEAGFTLLKT